MAPVSREILLKLRKLASLPDDVRQCQFAVSITKLTVLKSLCHEPELANRFVTYLVRKTVENVKRERSSHTDPSTDTQHQTLIEKALKRMETWLRKPTDTLRQTLKGLLTRMRAEQNEYKNISWGAVRIIIDQKLLLVEYALSCILESENAGWWAYQTARHYTERYDASLGTGLLSSSIPLIQDIVDFWMKEYDLTTESLANPSKARKAKTNQPSAKTPNKKQESNEDVKFTHRQGQFLAFIHLYWKLNRQGPAELDMVRFFRVTPPSVHSMVVKLEELGLITKRVGVARSMRIAIPTGQLPELEDNAGEPL